PGPPPPPPAAAPRPPPPPPARGPRFRDFADDEIADVLGCGRDSVRRYVSEARAKVSARVGNEERRVRGKGTSTP
ncbi:hypothetical protein K7G98_29455, partial [Saccharothrix sp. MB29]|nr:hypothetical protein [Saccharothrix sp. MB29]